MPQFIPAAIALAAETFGPELAETLGVAGTLGSIGGIDVASAVGSGLLGAGGLALGDVATGQKISPLGELLGGVGGAFTGPALSSAIFGPEAAASTASSAVAPAASIAAAPTAAGAGGSLS